MPAAFVALGVGADDIFIATRAWQLHVAPNTAERLRLLYRHGGEAMLTTTLTSCACFLATYMLTPMEAVQVPVGRCHGLHTWASTHGASAHGLPHMGLPHMEGVCVEGVCGRHPS